MTSAYWWGTWENSSPRMEVEVTAMAELFDVNIPTIYRQPVSWDSDFMVQTEKLELSLRNPKQPEWNMWFRMWNSTNDPRTPVAGNTKTTYHMRVIYAEIHPSAAPKVNFLEMGLGKTKHLYEGGNLCLYHIGGNYTGWNSGKSTAATMAQWGVQWLRAWMYYKKHGDWPEVSEKTK